MGYHPLPFLAWGSPSVWIAFGPVMLAASLASAADLAVVCPQFGCCAIPVRFGEQQSRAIAWALGHCFPQASCITDLVFLATVTPAEPCLALGHGFTGWSFTVQPCLCT